MEYLGLLVMGILLSTLGIVNIRGNISTIHAWNRKRVKEADIPPVRTGDRRGYACDRRGTYCIVSRDLLECRSHRLHHTSRSRDRSGPDPVCAAEI